MSCDDCKEKAFKKADRKAKMGFISVIIIIGLAIYGIISLIGKIL